MNATCETKKLRHIADSMLRMVNVPAHYITEIQDAADVIDEQAKRIGDLERQQQTEVIRSLIHVYDLNGMSASEVFWFVGEFLNRQMQDEPQIWSMQVKMIWNEWTDKYDEPETDGKDFIDHIRKVIDMAMPSDQAT